MIRSSSTEKEPPYAVIEVRVQPKASRNAISIEPDGRIRVALTAPPVEGAANKALIRFIAEVLGIAKGSVSLVRGEKSRDKALRITGMSPNDVRSRLQPGN